MPKRKPGEGKKEYIQRCTRYLIEKENKSVKVSSLGKKYVFPLNDCVFLPINSTSAENLASYILERLIDKISLPKHIESIEIGVDEGYGQGTKVSKTFKK